MSDFDHTYVRLMLLEFIVKLKVIDRLKGSLILGHGKTSCANFQYSLTVYLWFKLTSAAQFKRAKNELCE